MQTKTSYKIFIKPKAKLSLSCRSPSGRVAAHARWTDGRVLAWNLALKWQLHEMANTALYVHKVMSDMKKKTPDGFTDSQIFGSSEPI